MLLIFIHWIFVWGSIHPAFAATCPDTNLRVRTAYVPVYLLDDGVASSESLEKGDLKVGYDQNIHIPDQFVVCINNEIDYRRSLLRWSQSASEKDASQVGKFNDNQKRSDVFFPVSISAAAEGSSLPSQDSQTYLNLITLYNNGFLVPATAKAAGETPIPINDKNRNALNSVDIFYFDCPVNGKCGRRPGPTQQSPVNLNSESKNYKKLEKEELVCNQGEKNVCENIRPIIPKVPRDFFDKYAANLNASPQSAASFQAAFVEAYSPMALWLQTQTGIPASQLLAQLLLETATGASYIYQTGNNIGGISCGQSSKNLQRDISLYGKEFFIADKDCTTRKVGEAGLYFSYSSLEESILDWADNLLTSGFYPGIRAKSEKAKAGGAFNVAPFEQTDLKAYATDKMYMSRVQTIYNNIEIKNNFRNNPCQLCLQKQWEQKNKNGGTGVSK